MFCEAFCMLSNFIVLSFFQTFVNKNCYVLVMRLYPKRHVWKLVGASHHKWCCVVKMSLPYPSFKNKNFIAFDALSFRICAILLRQLLRQKSISFLFSFPISPCRRINFTPNNSQGGIQDPIYPLEFLYLHFLQTLENI